MIGFYYDNPQDFYISKYPIEWVQFWVGMTEVQKKAKNRIRLGSEQ